MASKKKGRIIGIVSFKGGVGKTTSAINLASSLKKLSNNVVVVDSNFSSPNLHAYMGLFNPKTTLNDIINNNSNIENAIYAHSSGIDIVPCSFGYNGINLKVFKEKIRSLKDKYDFIVLDSSPNLNEEMVAILMVSEALIFITTPDYPTLLSTMRAADIVKKRDLNLLGIVINKKRNKSFELKKADIEKVTKVPVIAELNDDIKLMEAASKFTPLINFSPKNKTALAYMKVANLVRNDKK